MRTEDRADRPCASHSVNFDGSILIVIPPGTLCVEAYRTRADGSRQVFETFVFGLASAFSGPLPAPLPSGSVEMIFDPETALRINLTP